MIYESTGYKSKVLEILKESGAVIGDIIKITVNDMVFEGTLMPRYELADDQHIVIKLVNGYNIGIRSLQGIKVEKIGVGAKPSFAAPLLPKENSNLPEVAIISTGGTIASRVDYRTGAVHAALSAQDLHSIVPELSDIAKVQVEILYSFLSENIRPSHWKGMAKAASKYCQEGVAGVVICHGTDTMGYSAAALSFALRELPVPIIIVGSQRSSDRPSTDAAINLVNAVQTAVKAPFAEVALCMHETTSDGAATLHRGTKVRKLHTSRRDAFQSVNISPLARIESGEITMLLNDYRRRDPERKVELKADFDERVALVMFHPSLSPDILEWYVDHKYRGIILEGTGLGHVGEYWFDAIRCAIEQGLLVGMSSQCLYGRINMKVYDTGRDLLSMGVIPLEDMLPETALVKMMWVLGSLQPTDFNEAKSYMLTNFAGEITPRSEFLDYL